MKNKIIIIINTNIVGKKRIESIKHQIKYTLFDKTSYLSMSKIFIYFKIDCSDMIGTLLR